MGFHSISEISKKTLLFTFFLFVLSQTGCGSSGGSSSSSGGGSTTSVSSVTITPAPTQNFKNVGDTATFTMTVKDSSGNVIPPSSLSMIEWLPDDEFSKVVSQNNTNGTAVLQALKQTSCDGTGFVEVCVNQVKDSSPTSVVVGSSGYVVVDPGVAAVEKNGTKTFTAKAYDQNNTEVKNVSFAWAAANLDSSSSQTVATVDQNGLATGKNNGQANITATASGYCNGASLLNVGTTTGYTLTLSPSAAVIAKGKTKQYTGTLTDSSGNTVSATVVWTSSNSAVATINPTSGLATSVTRGMVSIYAVAVNTTDPTKAGYATAPLSVSN